MKWANLFDTSEKLLENIILVVPDVTFFNHNSYLEFLATETSALFKITENSPFISFSRLQQFLKKTTEKHKMYRIIYSFILLEIV